MDLRLKPSCRRVTHSPLSPASALLFSCGCSSCRTALTGSRWPAAARSCTQPGPPAWPRSSRRCCRRRQHCCPLSSTSQHFSCGPVLQHQEYIRLLSCMAQVRTTGRSHYTLKQTCSDNKNLLQDFCCV